MIYGEDIIKICNGKLLCGDVDFECVHFCTDTRKIEAGDIYVGICGETFNGCDFYREAFDKGARACIVDSDTVIDGQYKDKTIFLVDDTIDCLQKLARYKRSLFHKPVIAITGSVGKTSVKDMVCSVIGTKYKVLGTKGNLNNHLGVPLTILELNDSYDVLVLEMGMNHFGELHTLSNIAKPTIGIITNVGTAHIGNLGSRENILKAKLEILDGMHDGTLIINNDNDLLKTVQYEHLITVGIDEKSDYMAYEITDKIFSQGFYVNGEYVDIPVGSRAFIYNSLFAFAVGVKLGMTLDEISDALRDFKLTPHRLELIQAKGIQVIDDTYNASLDSVRNSLELLSKVDGRRVFIFGDILELDTYGEHIHREIGEIVGEEKIDILITVGHLSKFTYDVARGGQCECYYFENNQELIENIDSIIQEGDTILVKGSHGMNLITIVDYLKEKYK